MSIRLHPKAGLYFFTSKVLSASFGVLILASPFIITSLLGGDSQNHVIGRVLYIMLTNGIGILIIFLLIIVLLIYSIQRANSYRIALNEQGIHLRYGVFGLSDEILFYQKIQDIVINQGVLERMFGLSSVTIHDSTGTPETIPGLAIESSEDLVGAVMENVNQAHSGQEINTGGGRPAKTFRRF